ncbi:hypothetical protein DIPPA_29898 [Diplonema papillatum]|nr:hypothetical protein DIPPA_29898 [Diplonema papillatum]
MATAECGRQVTLNDKKLTDVYGVSKTDAKFTCYCHHFTPEGKHVVSNNLTIDDAKKCNGVMYANKSACIGNFFGVSSLSLTCKAQRGTHKMCRDTMCPYVAAGQKCPYSIAADAS